MSDLEALRQTRNEKHFDEAWPGNIPDERTVKSEASINQLIDDLIALGAKPRKRDVRAAVERCAERFNEMDASAERFWITTAERGDIYYVLDQIVDLTGVECDDFDDWFNNAAW